MITQKHLILLGFFCLFIVQLAFAQDVQRYTVKQGDTLYRIARQHGLTVDDLKRLNNLTDNTIRPGQDLIVSGVTPQAVDEELPDPVFEPAREERTTDSPTSDPDTNQDQPRYKPITRAKRSYIVQPGDTYYSIAIEHGVPAYAIFAMNGGNTAPLVPNESIWIPDTDPITSFDNSSEQQTYTVRKGDTLYGIARKSGTNVQRIRQVNNLADNTLSVNQVIILPNPEPVRQNRDKQLPPIFQTGAVTTYPDTFSGRITASGVPYDPERYTVSHPELALKTIVLLTNPNSGHTTFAEVTDRGPLDTKFVMDVSAIVARELRLTAGLDEAIEIRVVE